MPQKIKGQANVPCLSIKEFVDSIDWNASESQFVFDFKLNINTSKHEEWDFENSESNFSIVNVCVDGVPVTKSYVRVSKKTKKLHRINLIMISQGDSEKSALDIIEAMTRDFGRPLKIEEERSRFIEGFTKTYYWESPDYDYKIELLYMVDPQNKQDIVIRLEPY